MQGLQFFLTGDGGSLGNGLLGYLNPETYLQALNTDIGILTNPDNLLAALPLVGYLGLGDDVAGAIAPGSLLGTFAPGFFAGPFDASSLLGSFDASTLLNSFDPASLLGDRSTRAHCSTRSTQLRCSEVVRREHTAQLSSTRFASRRGAGPKHTGNRPHVGAGQPAGIGPGHALGTQPGNEPSSFWDQSSTRSGPSNSTANVRVLRSEPQQSHAASCRSQRQASSQAGSVCHGEGRT